MNGTRSEPPARETILARSLTFLGRYAILSFTGRFFMLTIFLNWIYISFTTFSLGFAFSRFAEKALHYRIKRVDSILMTGLIIATSYAQIFSLFYRVNIEANAILTAACVLLCIVLRKEMFAFISNSLKKCSRIHRFLIVLLLLAWCYYTSRGYMVPDMNEYYGQSIRWIEEYGVVIGLGNVFGRTGYNSSIFVVSALYSMKFLLGVSLHTVNGFIALVLSITVLDLKKCFQRKKMLLSDFARVGAAYYLTTIIDEVLAPSSDYAVMCTIFFIVIKWLTQLEEPEEERRHNIAPYALLCVAGAYALTLKVTAGLILILLVKPAYGLLKEKRWKEIGIYLLLGMLAAIPWMVRTVIITGWLFFPLPELDLFDFDWKVPEHYARIDAFQIKVWAKGTNGNPDAGIAEWFPNWFNNGLFPTEKLLILADIAAVVLCAIVLVYVWIRKKREKWDVVLVWVTVVCSYLYWQLTAPMMRYGYAYVLLLATLAVGYLLQYSKVIAGFAYVFLILYGVHKLYICTSRVITTCDWPSYVWQETYDTYEMESYEVDGVTFYYNSTGGSAGYEAFPVSEEGDYFELRGDSIKDGFRMR